MKIKINHDTIEIHDGSNLQQAILIYNSEIKVFCVALNGNIVPRACYASTLLQSNDLIDIIVPMQGG
jgi:thiamine biosynthesis protein ThiS